MLLLSCLLHLNLPDSLLILVLGHLDDAFAIFIITGSLLNPSVKQLTKLVLVEFDHIVLVFIFLPVHVAFVHEVLLIFDLIFITILLLVLAFLLVHIVLIHHLLTFVVILVSFLNHNLSAVVLILLLLDAHLVVLVLRDTLTSLVALVVFLVLLAFTIIFLDLTFALVASFAFFISVLNVLFIALVIILDLVLLLDVLHLLLLIDSVLREVGSFQVQLIVILSGNEELTLFVSQVLFRHHAGIFQDSHIPLKLFDLVQVVDERV